MKMERILINETLDVFVVSHNFGITFSMMHELYVDQNLLWKQSNPHMLVCNKQIQMVPTDNMFINQDEILAIYFKIWIAYQGGKCELD